MRTVDLFVHSTPISCYFFLVGLIIITFLFSALILHLSNHSSPWVSVWLLLPLYTIVTVSPHYYDYIN
jgi:hypothetical protein